MSSVIPVGTYAPSEDPPPAAHHRGQLLPPLDSIEWSPGAGTTAMALRYILHILTADYTVDTVSPPSDAPTWLGDVYSFVQKNQPDDAADVLFRNIDGLLSKGEFARCNELLHAVDLKRLDTNLIVALLSITLRPAPYLPYRVRLMDRARRRLLELAPTRVDRLLRGLG